MRGLFEVQIRACAVAVPVSARARGEARRLRARQIFFAGVAKKQDPTQTPIDVAGKTA